MFSTLLLLSSLLGAPRAQSQTAGAIKGRVLTEDGLPIPGVMITVSSESLVEDLKVQTNTEGRFLLPELPPGTYELTATRSGFVVVRKTGAQVNVARSTIINVELRQPSDWREAPIPVSRPVIDTQSGDRGSVLERSFLQRLPIR